MSPSLVLFLHGVGSRGADLAPLGESWRVLLPGATFVSPDAPFPFEFGGAGRQWFSVKGVTEANRPERILAAREAFDAVLGAALDEHGFANKLDRVALVGFSQGTIMALDALASGRWPVAAVVGFAGRLASPEPLSPSAGTKTLLVHGDADQVMPVQLIDDAQQTLRQLGVSVEAHKLPGVSHTISPQGVALAGSFLQRELGS